MINAQTVMRIARLLDAKTMDLLVHFVLIFNAILVQIMYQELVHNAKLMRVGYLIVLVIVILPEPVVMKSVVIKAVRLVLIQGLCIV